MTEPIRYFGTGHDAGDYSFLSNFYRHDGDLTVEHDYQAAKTHDPSWRNRIMMAPTPGEAKKLGRKAPLRPDWEEINIDVMRDCLRRKFRDGTELAVRLLATGDAELIEGNWWGDKFWGQVDGVGENWLGKLLMERRAQLRSRDALQRMFEQAEELRLYGDSE